MKHFFALMTFILIVLPLRSQETVASTIKEKSPSMAIAFSLIPYAYNTAEIDLDIKLKERQWLTIAPRMQYGDGGDYWSDPMNTIKNGIGLGLNYRYFPLTRSTRLNLDGFGPFVSVGLRGQTTLYEYIGNEYVNYVDDYGVPGYYLLGEKTYTERASQLAFDVCLGYSLRILDIVFAEAFVGLGTRFSDYTYDSRIGFDLGENPWDSGYNGYNLTGGIRVGIFLDKYTH